MTKYYIVETHYRAQPHEDAKDIDLNQFEITTTPPKNAIGEICWDGWLGTTNDVARYAHGAYDSLAAAEHAVINSFGGGLFRRDPEEDLPPGVLAVYRPGSYVPDTILGLWLESLVDISADDTDDDLERQATAMIYEMQEEGCTVTHDRMLSALKTLRDNAREGIDD